MFSPMEASTVARPTWSSFTIKEGKDGWTGLGKLNKNLVVAHLSREAQETLLDLQSNGLRYKPLPVAWLTEHAR
eukprot:7647691-Prorocentrum_lima.AAC.1